MFQKSRNDSETNEDFAQANLEATSNKTYDNAINAAEANYYDALYSEQTLMFASLNTKHVIKSP